MRSRAAMTTVFVLRLCEGKPLVAVTRERRYGPSRLRPGPVLLPRRCCWAPSVGQQVIDISCSPGAQQQTRSTSLQRSIDKTDGLTPDRYIDPVPRTMRAVPITLYCYSAERREAGSCSWSRRDRSTKPRQLLSTRPAVTFPVAGSHRPMTGPRQLLSTRPAVTFPVAGSQRPMTGPRQLRAVDRLPHRHRRPGEASARLLHRRLDSARLPRPSRHRRRRHRSAASRIRLLGRIA